ncbi:MAG: flavoprotein, partial [Rikenellaceae bacterium]
LKERRRLVIVLRETPLSLVHLRNMTTLTQAGAVILPASPSYYMHPENIEELALTVSSRGVDMAGCQGDIARWRGKNLL